MCRLRVENHGATAVWVADSFFALVEYEGPDGVGLYGAFHLMKMDPNYVRLAPVVKVSKGYLSQQSVPVDLPLHSNAADPGARHVKVELDVTILESQGGRIVERTLTQERKFRSEHDQNSS